MRDRAEEFNVRFASANAREILEFFLKEHRGSIALSSSFGAEDQVLTDMVCKIDKEAYIFTLDTARLPDETYEAMHATNERYGIKVSLFFPHTEDVEKLYAEQGINGFYESAENRKRCCQVRKTEPLKRALSGVKIWITGLRAAQSMTRQMMRLFEFDEHNGVMKLNPLIAWSEEDVWEYIRKNDVPYNALHDKGYPSIGCAPCTRAVKEGEDIRSGRWWWENPEHKECGLHIKETQ